LFLDPSVYFGVDQGVPVLRRGKYGLSHKLQLGEAVALTYLNAIGRREEAADACAVEIANGDRWVDRVIDRYWSYFGGTQGKSADFDWLNQINFDTFEYSKVSRKNAAPESLVWLVTLACNRHCPYCYYQVHPHAVSIRYGPRDATYPKPAIMRMLAEMQRIGASKLYLTGGEPLLRKDIIEILSEAQRKRIRTYLSTKYPIEQKLANQLKEVNVESITYSLDAGDKRLADGLAGNKGFFEQSVTALRALRYAGLDPEVNAVATRVNIDRLDQLAQLLVDNGIQRLSISLFIPPPRYSSALAKLRPVQDDTQINTLISDFQVRWKGELEIRLGDSAQNHSVTFEANQPVCEVGYSELHVLPNGQASRCRYLPNETRLHLGSLEEMSIMDIWCGVKLNNLNSPSRQMFDGTACAACHLFSNCNSRGRCFASALQRTGDLIAPDVFCTRGSNH
jgi:pyrroloquinoline quinone biosynthesis protein E